MDVFNTNSGIVVTSGQAPPPVSIMETLLGLCIAGMMMHLELSRRAVNAPTVQGNSRWGATFSKESCKQLLSNCLPEVFLFVAALSVAFVLRVSADEGRPINDEAWEQIKRQWPLLMTADTLLSIQAILRLAVLLSCALRGSPSQPMAGWPAAFLSVGLIARGGLLARTTVYMLDGPVGGAVPALCELASLPLAAMLGMKAIKGSPMTFWTVVSAGVWLASRNYLSLAGDAIADSLFSCAHVMELLASAFYLINSVLAESGSGASAVFAHALLPAQQALAAYYFVEAFEGVPSLIGAGRPFELLQIGGAAQLGFFLAATALFLAQLAEGPERQGDTPSQPQHQLLQQQMPQPMQQVVY